MEKKKDIRLNKDFRNLYIKDFRRFLESQTNNPKYQAFLEARENCQTKIDDAFKTATAVVERRFNPTDVADLRRLQRKYTTVDSVGKDSCFYMAVVDDTGKEVKELDESNDEVAKSKHFDFNLKGSLNGSEYNRQKDFAYAWYREEMKANGLNPDCNIEHSGNQNNPALSTHQNNNGDWLKGNGGSSSVASHISQDYMKFCGKKVSILSDPSMITMLTNDFGYKNAYQKFLEFYVENDTLVVIMSSSGESENMLRCLDWCEGNRIPYGVLTGFDANNNIRMQTNHALWNYHIDSFDYGVVECVHQIFLHGVV